MLARYEPKPGRQVSAILEQLVLERGTPKVIVSDNVLRQQSISAPG
jgi:hypothetical protein